MDEAIILEILQEYKKILRNKGLDGAADELYKWSSLKKYRGRPNLDADNLLEELKSIEFHNLIFHMGKAVMKHLAEAKTEEYRACLSALFDESVDLEIRVKEFKESVESIYRKQVPDKKLQSHHDERTIATLLTYRNPDKYSFYKYTFYSNFCKRLGIPRAGKFKKYTHYMELTDVLINEYIKKDQELLELFNEHLPDNVYQDPNYRVLVQDILYRVLEKEPVLAQNYWRLGSSDRVNSQWDDMYNNNVISIGWTELGDLEQQSLNNRALIMERLQSEGYYPNDNRTASQKAGEIYAFYREVEEGDIVLVQNGTDILGIAIVEGSYQYNSDFDFAHQKKVRWLTTEVSFGNTDTLRRSVNKITNEEVIEQVKELIGQVEEIEDEGDLLTDRVQFFIDLLKHKKQIILQGPPGTGKTYLAKKIAERMASSPQNGHWKLVQFHPSFTYEDFVRGITVSSDSQAKLVYETNNKVLAEFAEEALSNTKEVNKDKKQLSKEQQIEKLLAEFAEIVAEEIVENEVYKITDAVSIIEVEEDAFRYSGTWKVSQRMKLKDLVIAQLNQVTTRQGLLELEDVSGLAKHHASYFIKVLNKFQEKYATRLNQVVEIPVVQPTLKNYVLIIDEINRANLPSVLGELIYALEYRGEAVESIYAVDGDRRIILPENLYIIGTMNTADRSVGQIDYAIRRRFAFVDVLPNREVIELDKAKELFDKVAALFTGENETSGESYLAPDFDAKDVQLGHSYFMAKDEAELKIRWKYEILPILREYVKDGLLLESANDKIDELEELI
jgi:5-methylcytosine-specific restriction protein B